MLFILEIVANPGETDVVLQLLQVGLIYLQVLHVLLTKSVPVGQH